MILKTGDLFRRFRVLRNAGAISGFIDGAERGAGS